MRFIKPGIRSSKAQSKGFTRIALGCVQLKISVERNTELESQYVIHSLSYNTTISAPKAPNNYTPV
ncbi:MAG: hypothetical protein HWD58_05035 [Bacteroidota bacterium]|nr:MAG: hypothetical protein HWD58_05035 [Bacteroidota bacterium]